MQVRVIDVAAETSQLVAECQAVADPAWISEFEVMYLVPRDDGSTKLFVADARGEAQ